MSYKKILYVLFVALFLFGCGKKGNNEIKIGAILPLTGDLATYGNNAKNGMLLYADQINSKGGINGKKIKLFFEDSKASPNSGLSAAQKLINDNKVIAIVGEVASSPLLAFAPLANKNKIVVVSPAASSPDLANAGPYIYRIWPSDVFEADRMAEYFGKNNINDLSILYVNNDYGLAMEKEIVNKLHLDNINIIKIESFGQNTTDVRTQLLKIKNSHAKNLYIISYPKEAIVIIKQIKEMGLNLALFATSAIEDPIIKQLGNIINGIIYTSPISPSDKDSLVKLFSINYLKKYNEKPGLVADYGYDALKVIIEAIKLSNNSSNEGVKIGIDKIHNLMGATGIINFDKTRGIIKPAGIKTIKDGQFIWLEK